MSAQQQHTVFTGYLSDTSGTTSAGSVMCLNAAATKYVIATTANLALQSLGSVGVAITAGDEDNPAVEIQFVGFIPASITALGVGLASQIRVSATGTLERFTSTVVGQETVGRCDTLGNARVHFSAGALVTGGSGISQSPSVATVVTDLVALEGDEFVDGVVAVARGYHTDGDGGGGSFTLEDTTPDSATITNVASSSRVITGASNTAPIRITSVNHQLTSGHSVLVENVTGNTGANGSWTVTVFDADTFVLDGTIGNGAYAGGGTARNTIVTTAAAHGLTSGARATIIGNGTSLDGTWWPIGVPRVTTGATTFTVPLYGLADGPVTGTVGDDAYSVPSTVLGKRWVRRTDETEIDAKWFGAKGDGVTDDTAALQAAISASGQLRKVCRIPYGTYLVTRELRVSDANTVVRGDGFTDLGGGNPGRTVLRAGTLGQRSVMHVAAAWCIVDSARIDGDEKASYGLYFTYASESMFKNLWLENNLFDGIHLGAAPDDGNTTFNDGIQFVDCNATDNGRYFHPGFYGGLRLNPIAATGTVVVNAYSQTITGSGTNFLSSYARPGDFIIVSYFGSIVAYEIESVDSDTQITVPAGGIPLVTHTDESYIIGVGDGFHEAPACVDNANAYIRGGTWRANAGSAITVGRGLYGITAISNHIDGNGVAGYVVGSNLAASSGLATALIKPHLEGQSGVAAAVLSVNALALDIIAPLWDGADPLRRLVIVHQSQRQCIRVFDTAGTSHYAGIHSQYAVSRRSRYGTYGFVDIGAGSHDIDVNCFVSNASVFAQAQIPVSALNHAGSIRVTVTGTYTNSGTQQGQRDVRLGYDQTGEVMTFGAIDDLTPIGQWDDDVPEPTFEQSGRNIIIKFWPQTSPSGAGAIYYEGEARVDVAAKP